MNSETVPVRLAFVITGLAVGGAERCLAEVATRIDRRAFQPAVFSLQPRPDSGRDLLVQKLEAAGVPVAFANLRSKWAAPLAVGRLTRLMARQRPQIVQNFLFHANLCGTLAASQLQVPHILMGMRVADPRRSRIWLECRLARRLGRAVCVSKSVADFYRTRGFPSELLEVIPNGVDVPAFASAEPLDLASLGVAPGRQAIVFVGRLDPQKGLSEFLAQIAPTILNCAPAHDIVLIGEGPAREMLVRQAKDLQVADRVHFAGWRRDIASVLAAADLLILPSRWEGMPNAVLEAMAAGKPVVAYRAEGVCELLGEQAAVQAVPSDQPQVFAQAVLQILQNTQLARFLGQSNRSRAQEAFSLDAMLGRYEQLYHSLLTV